MSTDEAAFRAGYEAAQADAIGAIQTLARQSDTPGPAYLAGHLCVAAIRAADVRRAWDRWAAR